MCAAIIGDGGAIVVNDGVAGSLGGSGAEIDGAAGLKVSAVEHRKREMETILREGNLEIWGIRKPRSKFGILENRYLE